MKLEKEIVCLRSCEKCIRDLCTEHHPNNYDCPNFKPIPLRTFYVQENYKTEEMFIGSKV